MQSERGNQRVPSSGRLWLKSLGPGLWLAMLILVLALPAYNFFVISTAIDEQASRDYIQKLTLLIIPALVILNPLVVLKSFVEAPSSELLQQITIEKKAYRWTPLWIFGLFMILIAGVFTLFSVLGFIGPGFAIALWHFMIFLYGLCYCISLISRNTNLGFFVLFGFLILSFLYQRELPFFPFLGQSSMIQPGELVPRILLFPITGLALIWLPELESRGH